MIIDIAKDGAFWEKVRTDDDYSRFRDEIKKKYDEVFSEEKPRPRSAKEILENNDHAIYFRSLRQLQTAALMALIYQNDETYYDNLVDIVWAYLNDYSWAPLGHYNEYYDRTPMDYDPTLIDIFAASNALSLAEIKYLFKDRFPKLLIDRITAEIKRRVIDSYVSRRFFWEHHDNNWTAVCTGAVGCVLMYEAPDIFWQQKERLDKSMECYLNSYKDDGMCVEGIGYWGFGFGFFTVYALELREFSQGKYDYFKLEKVKAISKFLQKMFLFMKTKVWTAKVNK